MQRTKLLQHAKNNPVGVRFTDLCRLAEGFGFRLKRITGSHRFYSRPGVEELLNFQEDDGMAKSCQVKQLLTIVEKHGLSLEDD